MMRAMPFLLLLLVLGLAACGDDPAPSGLGGELRFVKSGGIAGDHVELNVQPSGEAKLVSLRAARERTFRLSDEELASLAQSAENLPAQDSAAPRPAPDAFVYTVTYDGRTAKTDDPNLRKSGFSPLIGELQKIVEAHAG